MVKLHIYLSILLPLYYIHVTRSQKKSCFVFCPTRKHRIKFWNIRCIWFIIHKMFEKFKGSIQGHSSAVGAHKQPAGQQYQLASGQQPRGHFVSFGPSQLSLASFFFNKSLKILGPKGHSSAVAAQCIQSEQQYILVPSEQQPHGHVVWSESQLVLVNSNLRLGVLGVLGTGVLGTGVLGLEELDATRTTKTIPIMKNFFMMTDFWTFATYIN